MAGLFDFDPEAQVFDDLAIGWDDPDNSGGLSFYLSPLTITVTEVALGIDAGLLFALDPLIITVTPVAETITPGNVDLTLSPLVITVTPTVLHLRPPPLPPPARRGLTGAQLLDLPPNLGQRKESVVFAILNYDLTFAFLATHIDRKNPPQIHFDANSDTNRTLSGLRFSAEDAERINPLVHLVQPYWALDVDPLWPMGVFHFADTPLETRSYGTDFVPQCYDRSVILNQERAGTFTISPGTLLTTAARTIIAEVGLSYWTAIDNSAVFASAPQIYQSGSTRKTILKGICEALGFYPPFFDNDGFLRLRAVPNPISSADPDAVYTADPGSRIVRDSVKVSSNIVSAPNVYRVVGSPAAGGEVVGEFYVPATAPHSVEHRGFEVVKRVSNQGVEDQQAANTAAQAAYVNDFDTYIQVELETSPDPRADGMQIVQYLETNYREQSFSLECSPGGAMLHVLQEIWQP